MDNRSELPLAILGTLPNPVLVKDKDLRYVWVNHAFEELFNVDTNSLVGRTDKDVFTHRQAAQCNGGDLRVLASGEIDEATETVVNSSGEQRETLTRKRRLEADGSIYLVGIMHDITEITRVNELLHEKSAALELLANTDSLTGCLTRRALLEQWQQQIVPETGAAVLMIDVDKFKAVNDTYGHETGDHVLTTLAERTRTALPNNSLLARYGGEEFVAVIPDCTTERAFAAAERLRLAVGTTPIATPTGPLVATISVGISHCVSPDTADLNKAISRADTNLYLAKKRGRNQSLAA